MKRKGLENPFLLEALPKRASKKVLHGDVVFPVLRTALVVDGDYVRVGEGGRTPGLEPELLDKLLVLSVLLSQGLQRYGPVEDLVVSQLHLRYAALPRRRRST